MAIFRRMHRPFGPAHGHIETIRAWRTTSLWTGLVGLALGGLIGIGIVEASLERNLRRTGPSQTLASAAPASVAGFSAAFEIKLQSHGLGLVALPLNQTAPVADWDFDLGLAPGWSGPATVRVTPTGLSVRTTSSPGRQLYSSAFVLSAGRYTLALPFALVKGGGLKVQILNARTMRAAASGVYPSGGGDAKPTVGLLDFTVSGRGEYEVVVSNSLTSRSSSSWKLGDTAMYKLR
jgi:hypothetical protein